MVDLFRLEQQPKRIHDTPEAAALVEVLKALNTHSAVACRERMNSGAAMVGNRFIRLAGRVATMCWANCMMAACWVLKLKHQPESCDPSRPFSWSASVGLVA